MPRDFIKLLFLIDLDSDHFPIQEEALTTLAFQRCLKSIGSSLDTRFSLLVGAPSVGLSLTCHRMASNVDPSEKVPPDVSLL